MDCNSCVDTMLNAFLLTSDASEFLSVELEDLERVQDHLKTCQSCKAVARVITALDASMRDYGVQVFDSDSELHAVADDVLAKLRAMETQSPEARGKNQRAGGASRRIQEMGSGPGRPDDFDKDKGKKTDARRQETSIG